MEEDDMDFTPSLNTNSNLASLFGLNKKPLKGNPTLTYTAPKPPKRESSPAKKESAEQKQIKGKILFSKAVHVYKLENGQYVGMGLNGIVISGSHSSCIYEIILYKPTKEHISQTKISKTFSITLSPNNYVSFYDNNKQNWSIMFLNSPEMEEFSQKLAVCKFYCHPGPHDRILIQDLTPVNQSEKVDSSATVDVIYSTLSLSPEESTKLKDEISERIKLSDYSFTALSNSLVGCTESSKRVIIIPNSLSGQWKNELSANKDLLIEVKSIKIITESENLTSGGKLPEDGPESPIDSSAEEASIKARGASIKEALVNKKSQKASLISRMAKMGQATLPLRQGLSGGQSDSEEEGSLMSSTKPRMQRSRLSVNNPHQNFSISQTSQTHNAEGCQQLSVYHNDVAWQQSPKTGVQYQQLIPVSASPISSPTTDPSLSVYVSESRIQATELRMGMSKISEKLDLVWNKVQNLSENKSHQPPVMDSGGILSSIQGLITENESLKEKVQEQKEKIEQQNDRIFHLLELNHKYLERSSTTHDKQSENELKLKSEIESLLMKETEAEANNRRTTERIKNLEGELGVAEKVNQELRKKVEEMREEIEGLRKSVEGNDDMRKKEVETLMEKMSRASEAVAKLKERLREVISENEKLKSVIKTQKDEIETESQAAKDSKVKTEEYEKTVETLKKQISVEEAKTESKIESLSKTVVTLKEENKSLLEKLQEANNRKDDKNTLALVLRVLKSKIPDKGEFSSFSSTMEKVFSEAIDGSFKYEETEIAQVQKPPVVPTPRTSLQNAETSAKETEESQPAENQVKITNLAKNTAESQSTVNETKEAIQTPGESEKKQQAGDEKGKNSPRHQSYDQLWRTTKPPPPPLFDDEDDEYDWLN